MIIMKTGCLAFLLLQTLSAFSMAELRVISSFTRDNLLRASVSGSSTSVQAREVEIVIVSEEFKEVPKSLIVLFEPKVSSTFGSWSGAPVNCFGLSS